MYLGVRNQRRIYGSLNRRLVTYAQVVVNPTIIRSRRPRKVIKFTYQTVVPFILTPFVRVNRMIAHCKLSFDLNQSPPRSYATWNTTTKNEYIYSQTVDTMELK